jgi:hypothetical protein
MEDQPASRRCAQQRIRIAQVTLALFHLEFRDPATADAAHKSAHLISAFDK